MKKTKPIIVMAVLCLNLSIAAQAQKTLSKGIQVGQKVPEVAILSPFVGKMIILDFWATWCAPCVAMMPKMEKLQEQFNDKIQVISVTYQKEEETKTFLEKLRKGIASPIVDISGDAVLRNFFPHIYLPHYVWIGVNGKVLAITGYKEVTAENIERMLASQSITPVGEKALKAVADLELKLDVPNQYDSKKPLTASGNGTDHLKPLFQSTLLPFSEQIKGGYNLRDLDGYRRITALNTSLQMLYQIAYGEHKVFFANSETINEAKDPDPINYTKNDGLIGQWLRAGHGYCYELLVDSNYRCNIYDLMKQDLHRYFPQYTSSLEKRKTMCYVLVRTSGIDKLKSKGGSYISHFDATGCRMRNMNLSRLVARLEAYFFPYTAYPFVNDTGYSGPVDLDIKANLQNIDSINAALADYDLQFIKAERVVDMIIIRDTPSNTHTQTQPAKL